MHSQNSFIIIILSVCIMAVTGFLGITKVRGVFQQKYLEDNHWEPRVSIDIHITQVVCYLIVLV